MLSVHIGDVGCTVMAEPHDHLQIRSDGCAPVPALSSVCWTVWMPRSISSPVRAAASSGSRSAIQTNRVLPPSAAKTWAEAL